MTTPSQLATEFDFSPDAGFNPGNFNISAPSVSGGMFGFKGVTPTNGGVFSPVGSTMGGQIAPSLKNLSQGRDPDLGTKQQGSFSGFTPRRAGGGPGNLFQQLISALGIDIAAQQGAIDQHQAAIGQQANALGSFASGAQARAQAGAQAATAGLSGLIAGGIAPTFDPSGFQQQTQGIMGDLASAQQGALSDFDQAAAGISANVAGTVAGVNATAQQALGTADLTIQAAQNAQQLGQDAIVTADQAVSQFNKDASANIAATVAGMEARTKQQMKIVESGLNPDGTLMTPAQRAQSIATMTENLTVATGQVAGQMQADFDKFAAGLTTNAANVRLQAGQIELGAADRFTAATGQQLQAGNLQLAAGTLQAQVDSELAATKLNVQNNMSQFAANLGGDLATTQANLELAASQQHIQAAEIEGNFQQAVANINNMANLQGLQLELAGQTAAAELIANNPQSTVSIFTALAGMFQLATTPGVFDLESLPLDSLGLGGGSIGGN